ncbi:hypothetical protein EBR66_03640 [bacterium]|nr:hypothetical protein [bacterium]
MDENPIEELEKVVHNVHELSVQHTRPLFSKYPLLFAFLVVFSIGALLHGFDLWIDSVPVLKQHPGYLMLAGIGGLLITGSLYSWLEKVQ